MAQYYQVLSQEDKNSVEELRQYYPNLIENQTVQYVISAEDQQQHFQGQQILLSSDQLMVIDGQNQHLIVEQSSGFQNSQYILQDSTTDFQTDTRTQSQQIYYMEDTDCDHSVQIDQARQPVVLNHQLQQVSTMRSPLTNPPKPVIPLQTQLSQQTRQIQTQSSVREIVQSRAVTAPQDHNQSILSRTTAIPHQQIRQQQAHLQQHQTALATQQKIANRILPTSHVGVPRNHQLNDVPSLHFTQPKIKRNDMMETESNEAIALADGRVISISEYKKMVAENKQQTNLPTQTQERMNTLNKYESTINHDPKPKIDKSPHVNKIPNRRPTGQGNSNNSAHRPILNNVNAMQQQRFAAQSSINQLQKQRLPQNQYIQQQQHQQVQRQQLLQQNAMRQVQHQQHNQPPQQHHLVQQTQYVQPQYIIQPPSQHQPQVYCPLPPYVASSKLQQIIENTPVGEEYSDSIRMLVLLESGEQRLITFTLPKEVCTIQEILDQVGVPFQSDTKIELTETNFAGINYVVTVGNPQAHALLNQEEAIESEQANSQKSLETPSTLMETQTPTVVRSPTPESAVEIETPRYVPGLLAVCNHCGYTSENFNRCLRCKFKLPEDVKTVNVGLNNDNTKDDGTKNHHCGDKKGFPLKPAIATKMSLNGPIKKKRPKMMEPEPVVLTLSSDEEEEDSTKNKVSETDQLIRRLSNSSVTLSAIKKEPTVSDIQRNSETFAAKGGGKDNSTEESNFLTLLACRTIRIGSYRFVPNDKLIMNSNEIIFKVPMPKEPNVVKTIIIDRKNIVKVLVSFQKLLMVIFYYVSEYVGENIRKELGMVEGDDLYFDPVSKEESFKRITILPEAISEEAKNAIKNIYGKLENVMDELTIKEANDLLVMTCPKELHKAIECSGSRLEVKHLLIYPPGKGGLSINTEDYFCLAQDQFLNDVIIDFYLKYLILNLPGELQEKVHVFSTFFYKRLTTKPTKASRRSHPAELDSTLSAAQKRHARVEKWTKSVNLFEKDYIIIPINESCHWFLAIICFPGLEGSFSMEDGKPINIIPTQKRKKSSTRTIGNVTITTIKQEKEEKAIPCDDGEYSDKDEAEGDESELDSGEESEELELERVQASKRPPIKEPCILIFDSLGGCGRNRVVATLRDYLTCEYKVKMGKEKVFNKDVIKGSCPKVPQQTNFTDCGLYLLQYVEQFFKDPIKDYYRPIKELKNWFDEMVVTRKREDIANLIKELMIQYNKDVSVLPDITLPTLDGKLITVNHEDEDSFMDESDDLQDEMSTSNDLINVKSQSDVSLDPIHTDTSDNSLKRYENDEDNKESPSENVKVCCGFVSQPLLAEVKEPDNEIQKSKRDALSYLKAKRINRHKNSETIPNLKKFKSE